MSKSQDDKEEDNEDQGATTTTTPTSSSGERTEAETETADEYSDDNGEDNDEDKDNQADDDDQDEDRRLDDLMPMKDNSMAGTRRQQDHTPDHRCGQLLVGWKWGTTGRGWIATTANTLPHPTSNCCTQFFFCNYSFNE